MYNQVKFPFPEEAQQTWFSFCCEHWAIFVECTY